MNLNVVIEISKGSNVKYEYDFKTKKLFVDRILSTPVTYFFNYGFIENTIGGDGDAIDALVLCEESLFPTCYIQCRPVGVLYTEDEHGDDAKVLLVPVSCVNPVYDNINELSDINEETKKKLVFFFENYKKMEKNKWTKVGNFDDKTAAEKIIKDGQSKYNLVKPQLTEN